MISEEGLTTSATFLPSITLMRKCSTSGPRGDWLMLLKDGDARN
ncbi:unnamed protein product, partial [Larinioides sclopetarius]